MRVLFCAHRYFPEIGGVPIVTDLVCRELLRAGWEVEVTTTTTVVDPALDPFPYPVLRGWSVGALRRRMRAVDCVVLQHVSLRHILPLWLSGARGLTVLHMDLEKWSKKSAVIARIFAWHVRLSRHTAAASDALRRQIPGVRITLRNPYDDALFFTPPDLPPAPRERLAFVGRVVPVKGLEFAIEALDSLRSRGRDCHLTVIGDGPALPEMRALARRLALEPWITFLGEKRREEIPPLLRELGTLLVPSNYFEAFGLVAVEALACGLDVVAFPRGGLPEAVGAAGLVCAESTSASLVTQVERLLDDTALRERMHAARGAHLATYRKENAAARYREVIAAIVRGETPVSSPA